MAARVSGDLEEAAASAGPPVADRLTATAAELEAEMEAIGATLRLGS